MHDRARRSAALLPAERAKAPLDRPELDRGGRAGDGDLLVGSLRAQALHRLRRDGDGRVVYSEPIQLGQRLRDIAALPDGTLAIWTDSARLMFLSVDRARLAANHRPM